MQPTPQDIQLMSKHRVLSFKAQLRLEWRGQDGQNETEQPDHSASLGDSITSSTQIRFSVHTTQLRIGDSRHQQSPDPRMKAMRRGGPSNRLATDYSALGFTSLRQFLGLESFHVCGGNRNRNPNVPWSGAIPVAQLHLYPLRDHPVHSEHGCGEARVESRNRINKLHYERTGGVHALSYVSSSGRLEDGSASNLLCKFEKRE